VLQKKIVLPRVKFAGAIQDNDRGLSWDVLGKGLVQREMDFDDGSARLTVARYYLQVGRYKSLSKGNEEYFNESEKRFESGELYEKRQ
jgi:carboxyl-terminal processing protease